MVILTATLDRSVRRGDLVSRDDFTSVVMDPHDGGDLVSRYRQGVAHAKQLFGAGNYVCEIRDGGHLYFRRVEW